MRLVSAGKKPCGEAIRPDRGEVRNSAQNQERSKRTNHWLISIKAAEAALGEAVQGPLIFRDELVDNVAILELRRQDGPGIRFHFQMRAEAGICSENIQDPKQMIGSIVELAGWRTMQGDVEMDAPFVTGSGG
jgi:hypothetical protein